MSFAVPQFPLHCRFYSAGTAPPQPARVVSQCNLAYGKRAFTQFWNWADQADASIFATLLLPPGTDARDVFSVGGADLCVCPGGSGRTYEVVYVDDIGAGFANEHRVALLRKTGTWPTPLPGIYGVAPVVQPGAQSAVDTRRRTG